MCIYLLAVASAELVQCVDSVLSLTVNALDWCCGRCFIRNCATSLGETRSQTQRDGSLV
jgi:hypothetical protein